MNIFWHEFKAHIKSLLIWSLVLVLLIAIAVSKYAGFAESPELLSMLDAMPPGVIRAMSMDAFNLTTLSGFFGLMFLYFSLMGAMAAAMWGSTVIAKEERDKTVEFALVLPISRSRLVTAKALAALAACGAFVLITWGVSILSVQSYQPDREFYDFLALEMLAMFLIEVIFLAVGLLLGCAMQRYKRAGSTAVAVILVTYFLSIVADLQDNMAFLRYLTPFKYFSAADLFRSGKIETLSLLLTAVIVAVSIAAAYWAYNRRDLYI